MRVNFTISFILLVIAQAVICNYFNFSIYITFTILPVLIMRLPLNVSTIPAMAIAMATGLSVDFLADGLPGLNAAALIPVAFARKGIIQLVYGMRSSDRNEAHAIAQSGFWKTSLSVLPALAIFLAVYILADGAGTRPFWFNAARFGASLGCSLILSLITANILPSIYQSDRHDGI